MNVQPQEKLIGIIIINLYIAVYDTYLKYLKSISLSLSLSLSHLSLSLSLVFNISLTLARFRSFIRRRSQVIYSFVAERVRYAGVVDFDYDVTTLQDR